MDAIELLLQAAPTDLTILITGETGTGKEIFANAIHGLSNRSDKPFVSVNCGAIPESLLESELFGHEKGAFTSANEQRIGFFETANKGTIFLDEIGELPLGTQVKLLRVLESGEFTRLGSSTARKVDVRIIAATNRELEKEVQEGKFRQDLFFRLNNVRITLPPLRQRPEDIKDLVDYFANLVSRKLSNDYEGIEDEAVNILKSLPWSGNIRELKNLVETIMTLEKVNYITADVVRKYIPRALPAHEYMDSDKKKSLISLRREEDHEEDFSDKSQKKELGIIFRTLLEMRNEMSDLRYAMHTLMNEIDDLKDHTPNQSYNEPVDHVNSEEEAFEQIEDMSLADIEKKMIERTLRRFSGKRRLAAQTLGISERTLYRKIRDYELD